MKTEMSQENSRYIHGTFVSVEILRITKEEKQTVYDFTTVKETHTFIANGIINSNCPVSTPEHAKIGLIKHLTMIGSLTIGDRDNTALVREWILNHPLVKRIDEIPVHEMKNVIKVFLGGEWLRVVENKYEVGNAYSDNPTLRFYVDAKVNKITGMFNPQMTSIVFDYKEGEIRINTD